MKVTPQTVGNILKKMDATRPAMAKTAKAKDKQLSYDEIRAKYLQAQKDVETWKRELEKALKRQEKQIETDRKSLGL
jgi:biopolymer transport protein ExbB/TolQ